jgi:hypothetical protein
MDRVRARQAAWQTEFPGWGPCFTMEVSGGEQELASNTKKDAGRTWLTVTAG